MSPSADPAAVPHGDVGIRAYEYEEPVMPENCIAKEILACGITNPGAFEPARFNVTRFCAKCISCEIFRKVRVRPLVLNGESIPSEGKRAMALRFWNHVDLHANNLYFTASQLDNDVMYPVTQMLQKDAILDHYMMRRFNNSFSFNDFVSPGMVSVCNPSKKLNAIQTEEIRLARAFACVASYYGEMVFKSKARSKFELLDIFDSLSKSLRMLWMADLGCRNLAMEDLK